MGVPKQGTDTEILVLHPNMKTGCVYIYVFMHRCVYKYICILYICMYYMYIYIYMYIHLYIYIHIHAHSFWVLTHICFSIVFFNDQSCDASPLVKVVDRCCHLVPEQVASSGTVRNKCNGNVVPTWSNQVLSTIWRICWISISQLAKSRPRTKKKLFATIYII
jgi:hypothetical protein